MRGKRLTIENKDSRSVGSDLLEAKEEDDSSTEAEDGEREPDFSGDAEWSVLWRGAGATHD